ncbi:MAG: Cys-tRNA(Pro) deacylase [Chloroflexi bacterium]|nr:Cys-tRNA(Pro) deacylase [Chloroflexota bacterium]MCL5275862.1 Cys-tRNA(Pro) deacylase [Chloroflexota bacterium]
MKKTKAIELLDRTGTAYELRAFEAVEFTAEEAAQKMGLPPGDIWKTLVARGERKGVVMAIVPGPHNLSLRKLAQAIGDKRAEMVDVSELMRLTGFLKGGVSPLGGRREYPIYIDASIHQHTRVSISAGQRGLQILIAPDDLIHATRATVADLIE